MSQCDLEGEDNHDNLDKNPDNHIDDAHLKNSHDVRYGKAY